MVTRKKRLPAGSRGFTLIELLIGAALAGIIFSGVMMAFIAGNRAFQTESHIAGAVEGQRAASAYLERLLRQAGYGVDPRFAFDFRAGGLPGTTKDNYNTFADTKVVTDDLAFRYRDPMYLRRGTLDGTALKIDATSPNPTNFGVKLKAGQPMIVMCPGAQSVAVGRIKTTVEADANTAILESYWKAAGDPFPNNLVDSLPSCFTATGTNAPYILLLHDVRIRVIGLGTNPMRPYLVVFHNHDAVDGNNKDYDPIAADVESFQVAYQMNRPPGANSRCASPAVVDAASTKPNWVLGDAESAATDLFPDPAATAPSLEIGYDEATCARYNKHPANIRAVRFSLVTRSANQGGKDGRRKYKQVKVENWDPSAQPADSFYRSLLTGSVRVPNLTSRGLFVPPLQAGSTSELNIWGG